MPELDILIPFAEDDEFIKYEELYKVALENSNVSVVTVDSSHMLDNPDYEDILSLSDERLLTGQILNFMQSLIDNYSKKVYIEKYGVVARLTSNNLIEYLDEKATLADSNG